MRGNAHESDRHYGRCDRRASSSGKGRSRADGSVAVRNLFLRNSRRSHRGRSRTAAGRIQGALRALRQTHALRAIQKRARPASNAFGGIALDTNDQSSQRDPRRARIVHATAATRGPSAPVVRRSSTHHQRIAAEDHFQSALPYRPATDAQQVHQYCIARRTDQASFGNNVGSGGAAIVSAAASDSTRRVTVVQFRATT